jgi:AcrR family transcriptional regulator
MHTTNEPSDTVDTTEPTASRLLKVAAALFREKGYVSSTTREIAARLGVQKATLYYYMEKKEDLLYAICLDSLVHLRREVELALSQQSTPLDRLRTLIRVHICTILFDQNLHLTMIREMRELVGERRREVQRLRDEYEELVRQSIAEAQAAGVLRPEPRAKYQGLALLNLLNWTATWYLPHGELTPEQISELFTEMFLEGALPRGGVLPPASLEKE